MKGFFLPCCLSCVPSLKAENIQGFVNEMDAVALCLQRITQLGFLPSPALSSPFFIRRLPRPQHVGVQLPSLSKSPGSSAPSDARSLSPSHCFCLVNVSFKLI